LKTYKITQKPAVEAMDKLLAEVAHDPRSAALGADKIRDESAKSFGILCQSSERIMSWPISDYDTYRQNVEEEIVKFKHDFVLMQDYYRSMNVIRSDQREVTHRAARKERDQIRAIEKKFPDHGEAFPANFRELIAKLAHRFNDTLKDQVTTGAFTESVWPSVVGKTRMMMNPRLLIGSRSCK